MKVTLINTSDAGGGAPEASMRLLKALELDGVDVHMQVQLKKTNEPRVSATVTDKQSALRAKFSFLYERLPFIFFHEKDKSVRFAFSTAPAGTDVSKKQLIIDADILHLHWTNSGFLSINNLKQLRALHKPMVWTLHDMWSFTGGCHYAGTCNHFMQECGNCYFLRDAGKNDISHKGWLRKKALMDEAGQLVFVACSNWLAGVARKSSLLKNFRIEVIPNPIDTDVFSPGNKNAARSKWGVNKDANVILFGADRKSVV